MGYLALFLTIVGNAFKGYASKSVSSHIHSPRQNMYINVIRGVLCIFLSFLLVFIGGQGLHALGASPTAFLMFATAGLITAVFQYSWISAMDKSAYMLVSVCGNASFILPLIGGITLLGEHMTLKKALAVLIICVAVYFMTAYSKKINKKLTVGAVLTLITIFVSQGSMQFLQKYYMSTFVGASGSVYTFYTFVFATLFSALFLVFSKRDTRSGKLNPHAYMLVLLMAAGMFISTFFSSVAAKHVEAVVLYPLTNVGSLTAGTLMSTLIFKEKMKKESAIGIVLVAVALLLYLL